MSFDAFQTFTRLNSLSILCVVFDEDYLPAVDKWIQSLTNLNSNYRPVPWSFPWSVATQDKSHFCLNLTWRTDFRSLYSPLGSSFSLVLIWHCTCFNLSIVDCDNSGRISTRCYLQFCQRFWGSIDTRHSKIAFTFRVDSPLSQASRFCWYRRHCTCFNTLDWLRQLRTDLDSMLLSICPKDFGDQHIDMTLENRGINFDQSRLPIVSSLIVPSYISVLHWLLL
jgi:hypothetical protein